LDGFWVYLYHEAAQMVSTGLLYRTILPPFAVRVLAQVNATVNAGNAVVPLRIAESVYVVDGRANYVMWRKLVRTTCTPSDNEVWRSHFGQIAGGRMAAGQIVP
jgi:hypothetical protein